jgi:hypothetical protein
LYWFDSLLSSEDTSIYPLSYKAGDPQNLLLLPKNLHFGCQNFSTGSSIIGMRMPAQAGTQRLAAFYELAFSGLSIMLIRVKELRRTIEPAGLVEKFLTDHAMETNARRMAARGVPRLW